MKSMSLPLLLLAVSSALSAPSSPHDGHTQVVLPQKRAALVLDRLLIALQKALREDAVDHDGPRTAPLRIASVDDNDMALADPQMGLSSEEAMAGAGLQDLEYPRSAPLRLATLGDDTSALQRRGQGGPRGRVLRCYFNAVTCF